MKPVPREFQLLTRAGVRPQGGGWSVGGPRSPPSLWPLVQRLEMQVLRLRTGERHWSGSVCVSEGECAHVAPSTSSCAAPHPSHTVNMRCTH